MATVRIVENILEDKVNTFSTESGRTIEELIRLYTTGDSYSGTYVECYDCETGETFFAPLEENTDTTNVIAQVNQKDVALDYVVQENDVVAIVITPSGGDNWSWAGAWSGLLTGIGSGAAIGSWFGGHGSIIGGIIGGVIGFFAGGILVAQMMKDLNNDDSSSTSGIDSDNLPDVRGSQNTPLTDQPIPFVLGKHLVTPFIVGSPWNEISGSHGETNYINILYAVGYAPLRLTDFKLGEQFLAHNQSWSGNEDLKNIWSGKISGIDTTAGSGEDKGEIVSTWSNNDVKLEILQQGQNGEGIDYGQTYPYAKIQTEVKANVLFIADGDVEDLDKEKQITYKGLGLKNGLRNNRIQFTEQYPHSANIELNFSSGLYKTRSETSDNNSTVKYYRIPMWVAIQWRVQSDENTSVGGDEAGVFNDLNWDASTKTYKTNGKALRSWHSFDKINNNIGTGVYTASNRVADLLAHSGNTFPGLHESLGDLEQTFYCSDDYMSEETVEAAWDAFDHWTYESGDQFTVDPNNKTAYTLSVISCTECGNTWYEITVDYTDPSTYSGHLNDGWLNQSVFNLESLGGTNDEQDGISEFRCIATLNEGNFVDWARAHLSYSSEADFIEKFKAYFYDASNSSKTIEVRVVRVSPCYLDETVSTKEHSAFKFNDIFTWANITSTVLDGDKLKADEPVIEQKRPLEERIMRKLCIVSLRAKTDNVDQLSNTLKKFTCIAQSFAPYYDDTEKKWFPENVNTITNYYNENGTVIDKAQFEQDRQNGRKSISTPGGNDFVKQLVNNVIRTNSHRLSDGRYYLPNDATLKYCNNNVASMFILAGIGAQLGIDALGYTQSFYDENHQLKGTYGDFNMAAFAQWYKWAECVTDGTTYTEDGTHYNHDGELVHHTAGEEVEMYFCANGYIYQKSTLETMLSKIAIAGRAVYTRDQKNRITVVIDKPEKYPVALINQQNTLKSSYTLSYAEQPSGLQIVFHDEDDGYVNNNFYCMADGEDPKNPRNAIEQYKFDYVTNNKQQWSLGRYLLANRILNKEVVTKQIGIEGASIALGDLVVVQDDLMLIGTDFGGRITKLIENNNTIFGFIINNTYEFTGETEPYEVEGTTYQRSVQGVTIMQPSQTRESRVITVRLGLNGQQAIDGDDVIYTLEKGNTNVVLFDTPIAKDDDSSNGNTVFVYKPQVDNMVGFGLISQETAKYRVVKIKPDAKRNYELTLMKYQEDLYSYGDKLPSFQNNMTIPDRSGEDAFALTNNVTQTDLVKSLAESAKLAQGKIDNTFGFAPPVPSGVTAHIKEDCIQLLCTVNVNEVNNIDHITYEITKYRLQNGVLETLVQTIDGSYSTEYYYDRTWEGYPEKKGASVVENDGSLNFWTFRAKAVSIYLDEDGVRYESDWSLPVNPSAASIANYGTWIPPQPSTVTFKASEEGITAEWNCDTSRVYGSVQYEVAVSYDNGSPSTQTTLIKSATYQFNRSVDGYPEKPNTQGMKVGTRTLEKYAVVIRAVNIVSGKITASNSTACDYSKYKTWIPSTPSISSRVSNRNATLYMSQGEQCYGNVQYLVGIRRYDDTVDTFYVPDLETNPYSRESAYKKVEGGLFVVGKIESESQFSQTLPLETQNGTSGILDVDNSSDEKLLAVPHPGSSDEKLLVMGLGGFAPIDTAYQFEVYAYNKTVEDFYDSQSSVDHHYNIDTYHKVSLLSAKKNVTALATSVQDVLNGSITSSKVGEGAITETKIEDDAISTPKLQANAVVADKIYTYNMATLTEGVHSISGFAYSPTTDDELFQYLYQEIRSGHNRAKHPDVYRTALEELDGTIKTRSTNYWIGLDTATPEFYMGDKVVGHKNDEDANYFHYYTDNGETNLDIKLSNFVVTAISSTIKGFFNVRNKNGNIKYTGANSFLQVNPEFDHGGSVEVEHIDGYFYNDLFYEDSAHTRLITPTTADIYKDITTPLTPTYYRWTGTAYVVTAGYVAGETVTIKGDVSITNKNSDNTAGTLTVQGLTSLIGGLQVGSQATGETALTQTTKIYSSVGITGETAIRGTLVVGTENAIENNTIFQVGDSTTNNTFTRIYGRLIITKGIASYNSIGATELSASGQVVGQGGVIANITQMTLESGLPSMQGTLSTKMYADAFALKGRGNDAAWLRFMEVSNDGFLEIATGDDGTEPIYVRQYNTSTQVVHQATLLDGSGNTSFPGNVTGTFIIPIRSSSYTPSTNGEIWIE